MNTNRYGYADEKRGIYLFRCLAGFFLSFHSRSPHLLFSLFVVRRCLSVIISIPKQKMCVCVYTQNLNNKQHPNKME